MTSTLRSAIPLCRSGIELLDDPRSREIDQDAEHDSDDAAAPKHPEPSEDRGDADCQNPERDSKLLRRH